MADGRGGLNTGGAPGVSEVGLDASGGAGVSEVGLDASGGAGVMAGREGMLRRALGGGGGALRSGDTGSGSGVAPGGEVRRGGGGGCALGRGTSEPGALGVPLGRGGALTGRGGVARFSPDPLFEASSSAMGRPSTQEPRQLRRVIDAAHFAPSRTVVRFEQPASVAAFRASSRAMRAPGDTLPGKFLGFARASRPKILSRRRASGTLSVVRASFHLTPTESPAESPKTGTPVVPLPQAKSDEPELLAGMIALRPAAVAELFDRYSSVVRSVLTRALGNPHDVEDIMQETFLTVVRRAPTLRKPSALPSFVVSVAIRLARNELRRRNIRRWIGLGEAKYVAHVSDDPIAREGLRRLDATLNLLDPTSKLLFILRHVEQMELRELAEVEQVSLATLKRRLARAERRFETLAQGDPLLREYLERSS
jgi:RNA polymerase sigma-70 factor (ECF subfamily)